MPTPPVPQAEKASEPLTPGHRMFSRILLLCYLLQGLLTLLVIQPLTAGTVYWGSETFGQHLDSKGRPWDQNFSLCLGVFETGFTPTQENRQEWLAHWTPLGIATFDPTESRFAGILDTASQPNTLSGRQVYFWASNGIDLTRGPEWLLLTHPTWVWPTQSANAPAITWTSCDALVFVLGQQTDHTLSSVAVRPVPISRNDWLAQFFRQNPNAALPEADPDGDGLSNSLEYFLGSAPNDPNSIVHPEFSIEQGKIHLSLARNPYATGQYLLKTSSDLHTWTLSDATPEVDRPDRLEFRLDLPPSPAAAFFRFEMESVTP